MKLFIACGAYAIFLLSSGPASAVPAAVVSDGAAVYEKPDFDSKVIDFLPYGMGVQVSKKAFSGIGGMGLFHRVRTKSGKLGYIPDTDIRASSKAREKEKTSKSVPVDNPDAPKSKAWAEEDEDPGTGRAPIYLTRYLGGAVARVNFTEKFSGRKLSDQLTMYGLRMTGPGTLWDGPPLDFNLWFSMDKPGYYNRFSSGASGFLLFGDVMAMMPLVNLDDWVVSYGLGIMYTFTKYRVQITRQGSNSPENADSLEFRLGLDLGLGVGRRIAKRFMIRGDVKYYFEKTQYLGYLLSFQREY